VEVVNRRSGEARTMVRDLLAKNAGALQAGVARQGPGPVPIPYPNTQGKQ